MINRYLAQLFDRDIRKLRSEIEKYESEAALWPVVPGTINSGGHLCQHLIGNLRTYVGLALGGVPYQRDREAEFTQRVFDKTQLLGELDRLADIVEASIENLTDQDLQAEFPRDILDMLPEQNVELVLLHLLAHLSYHTGQVNYHRRWISSQGVQ
jgi:uncharacterized damage-inducible protein DinB